MILENKQISIMVSSLGAELQSLKSSVGREFLWQGNQASWPGQSPVLFPIVGVLKDGKTLIKNREFAMSCHGFAAQLEFTLIDRGDDFLEYQLCPDDKTHQSYPWDFKLTIRYELKASELRVLYRVENTDKENIYFCLGAHPGFALHDQTQMTDYSLVFEKPESSETHLVAPQGLIRNETSPCLNGEVLELKDELFFNNALIFKDLKSTSVELKAQGLTLPSLKFSWQNFSSLGIWSLKDAGFICLEPWNGHGDMEDSDGRLVSKPDLLSLAPAQKFQCSWSVEVLG